MTDPFSQLELSGIASDPDAANLFNIDDFNSLFPLLTKLVPTSCNSKLIKIMVFYLYKQQ